MLYHRDIFVPKSVVDQLPLQCGLVPSKHAIRAMEQDRYGNFCIPKMIPVRPSNVFEYETDSRGRLVKFAIRGGYCSQFDLSLVIAIKDIYLVKTCWLNRKEDKHYTLDRTKYSSG